MMKRVLVSLCLMLTPSIAMAAEAAPACAPDALGTSRTLVVGTKGGQAVGLESYPRTLHLADHEVVLTFDDGPSAATTPMVLDALRQACVKATFFLIGRNTAADPDLVQRELAEGHTLGHHTFSHPARTLRRMSFEAAKADIERGFAADDLAAYGTSAGAPRVPFFRFPGFADTKELDVWLGTRDIAVFGTDIWAYDWLELSPQQELAILMRKLEIAKRGIILLHDTRPSTARMIPALLQALKAGGYKIVHIVPGPGTAEVDAAPKGWTSETDKVIAEVFAHEATQHAARRFALLHRWTPQHGRHARARPLRPMRTTRVATARRIASRQHRAWRRF